MSVGMAALRAFRPLSLSPSLSPLSSLSLSSHHQKSTILVPRSTSSSLLSSPSSSREISGAYNFLRTIISNEYEFNRPKEFSKLAQSEQVGVREAIRSFAGGVYKSLTYLNFSFLHMLMLMSGQKTTKAIITDGNPDEALEMKRDAMLMRRGYQDSGLFASLFLILTFPVGTLFGLGYHVVASRSFPRSLPGFFQTPRTHIHERAKSLDKRSQARMELIHTFHAFLERDNHSLEDVGEISLGLLEISKKIQNNERVTLDDMVAIMPLLTDPNYQKHELDDNEQLIYAKILDLPTDSLLLRRGTSMYNTVLNSLIEAFMKDDYILDLVGIDKLSDSEIIWSCERRGIWVDGEDEFDIGGDEARTSYLPFKDEAERIEEMRAVLKDWITISRTIVQFEFAASVPPEEWKEFMVEKKPLLTKTFMGALGLLHG